jgi:ELMO domain-containing protein
MGLEVTLEITEKGMKDERWMKFGFQNQNPRTDFRGAGILGVRNLIYFAENHKEVSSDLI